MGGRYLYQSATGLAIASNIFLPDALDRRLPHLTPNPESMRLLLLTLLLAPFVVTAQPSGDLAESPPTAHSTEAAVHAAVEDYLLGFYNAEPERLERSLHSELHKVGYWRDPEGAYHYSTMSFQQALELAAGWNADGSRVNNESPREIELLEVNDRTAIAKLTAIWGIDYFHLGQYDGEWKIINVIWQSLPPSSN